MTARLPWMMLCWIAVAQLCAAELLSDTENPHGNLGELSCVSCHSTQSWVPLKPVLDFDHSAASSWELSGSHQQLECLACHELDFLQVDQACSSCHTDVHQNTAGPDCQRCHNTGTWSDESDWQRLHLQTSFSLTGVHRQLACDRCHAGEDFSSADDACISCHTADYSQTNDPAHALLGFGTDCRSCHNTTAMDWSSDFSHIAEFPLTAGHAGLDCNQCHTAADIAGDMGRSCTACHQTTSENILDPDHSSLSFSADCGSCHTTAGWLPADFDHGLSTFSLTGAHSGANCLLCHEPEQVPRFSGLDQSCRGCHLGAASSLEDPDHAGAAFIADCATCHETTAWTPAGFDHGLSSFALESAHQSLDCQQCHEQESGIQYSNLPGTCWDCHQQNYQNAADPVHDPQAYSMDCMLCHSQQSWQGAALDHDLTQFPLLGAHQGLDCSVCHENGFVGTATACESCHLPAWQEAVDPPHEEQSFQLDCSRCHTQSAWQPSNFDHSQMTSYELTGAHTAVTCTDCHLQGTYQNTATDCWSCHQQNYEQTTDPNHNTLNYPQDCTACHSTADWDAEEFDHQQTQFPLQGAHGSLDCASCHEQGYQGTPFNCDACHLPQWEQADPRHEVPAFSLDCTQCHTQSTWTPATFDHTEMTDYPLAGAHTSIACAACHQEAYQGTATSCEACHLQQWELADPIHDEPSFGFDCTRCHGQSAWTPSTFDHTNMAGYLLSGAHNGALCVACHEAGQYVNTPSDCWFCHSDEYQQSTDPDHGAALFPENCTLCHTTTAWEPSTFDHDGLYFPIYSGEHRNEWDNCVDCHTSAGDFGQFSCLECHEHRQSEMDDEHDGVTNYVYSSDACLDCHEDGEERLKPRHKDFPELRMMR